LGSGNQLGVLQQLQGFVGVEVEVALVGHQAINVHNVLVEQHTGDLAGDGSVDDLDAGVDSVTDNLLALVHICNGINLSGVDLGSLDLGELRLS